MAWNMRSALAFPSRGREAPAADSVWDKLSMVDSLFAPKVAQHQQGSLAGGGGTPSAHQPTFRKTGYPPPPHVDRAKDSSQDLGHAAPAKPPYIERPAEEEDDSQTTTDGCDSDNESVQSRIIPFSAASTAAAPRPASDATSQLAACPPSLGIGVSGAQVAQHPSTPNPSAAPGGTMVASPHLGVSEGDFVASDTEALDAGLEGWIDASTISRLLTARLITKTLLKQSFSPQEIKDIRTVLCGPTLQNNTLKANNVADIVSACPATDPRTFVAAMRKAASRPTANSSNPSIALASDHISSQPPVPFETFSNAPLPNVSQAIHRHAAAPAALQSNPCSNYPTCAKPVHAGGDTREETASRVAAADTGTVGDGDARERAFWSDAQWHSHLLMRLKRDRVLDPVKRMVQSDWEYGAGKRAKVA